MGQEDLIGKYARENGLTRSQAADQINGPPELRAEMERIAARIERENPDNFVQFIMVRDPSVRMEVWFERDAARTLAKYTTSPLFVAREGGMNAQRQEELRAIWLARFEEAGGAINSLSTDNISRKVEIGVGIPEAEFRALAREKGWELGPELLLHFPSPQPAKYTDPMIGKLVRYFARENTSPGARNTALFIGRIWLDDGCFRLEREDGEDPLVMFAYEANLTIDEDRYLNIGTEYRVGEIGAWGGPAGYDENSEDVKALRAACGEGELVNVTFPGSNRLFSLPDPTWVTNYAQAKDMTRQAAWQEILACMKRRDRNGRGGLEARGACVRQFN